MWRSNGLENCKEIQIFSESNFEGVEVQWKTLEEGRRGWKDFFFFFTLSYSHPCICSDSRASRTHTILTNTCTCAFERKLDWSRDFSEETRELVASRQASGGMKKTRRYIQMKTAKKISRWSKCQDFSLRSILRAHQGIPNLRFVHLFSNLRGKCYPQSWNFLLFLRKLSHFGAIGWKKFYYICEFRSFSKKNEKLPW